MTEIVIIGVGRVGSAIAYSLLFRKWAGTLVLIDIDEKRVTGELLDLSHAGAVLNPRVSIELGCISDIRESDVVVITAGAARSRGMNMKTLEVINHDVISGLCESMAGIENNAQVIMVTNPAPEMQGIAANILKNRIMIPDLTLDAIRHKFYGNWEEVEMAGHEILDLKGFTNWGVAAATTRLIMHIIKGKV